ncbi:PQQ-binding-like beta-propeller repeat protein [Chitinophaga oryzae]|uniref:PQQ-binding-like beta-propeller repeat protein n=1 Tax=Chitinophaga oryzae TaxID=2725414 RepID=A0AAE7D8X8_9BACT|nr:PQQ-binding-like beta-propeller repeat protein [Chitinophaga oryzae]QJB33722.1 PQQ-binding-like beta-propeller repeat protein [Chitinophaga oryzae]QJB40246.1 PQQ-binding-like beta-propeller repeat protein [Chitinophaga oryzae]
MKKILFAFLSCCSLHTAMAQSFSGAVFLDGNANGKQDAAETGLPGVRVSDGLSVTITDKAGRFRLPGHARARFVFITTPAGYRTTKEFYIPADSSRTAYEFGLLASGKAAGDKAKFVRLADTETTQFNNWMTEAKEYARNENADFMIHTGDICYEKGMAFHAQHVNTRTMGLPVYYCIGNHDLVKGPYGEALYESLFGPVFYSFEAGPAHFIVTPMRYGDYQPSYTAEDVVKWLKNDLAHADPAKPVIVFNHDLLTYDTLFAVRAGNDSINLNEHNLKAWIYGHWHINFARTHGNTGIRSLCAAPPPDGGIDNSASNFDVVDIDKNGISLVQRRYTYVENQLTLVSPAANGTAFDQDKMVVSVNAYHTASPVKAVRFRMFDKKGNLLKELPLQQRTDWNWGAAAAVPAAGKNDVYTATVEATLGTGRILFTRDTFRLIKTVLPAVKSAEWPEVLGNAQRTGAARLPGTGTLSLKWTANIGGNIWKSSPICAEGKIFVGTIDDEGNNHSYITALDAATGRLLWQFTAGNSIKHSMSYSEGSILATDAEGVTYALNAATGKVRWKHQGLQQSLPGYNSGGVAQHGVYYTGAGRNLQALDIRTGEVKWTNRDWTGGEGTPAAMALRNGQLITGSNWSHLYAHDAATGRVQWKRSDEGIRFRSGTPAFFDDKLYVHGINKLHVLEPATGKTIDSIPVAAELKTMTAPLVTAQYIITCTASGGMIAFDKHTKAQVWQFVPGEALFYTAPYTSPASATIESTPLLAGNSLLVGASDGFVYAVDLASGKMLRRIAVGAPVFADMAVYNGMLYVADFSGNVNAYTL